MAEFDWVGARAECSLAKVFEQLRLTVKQDVERKNQTRPPGPPFDIVEVSGEFSVFSGSSKHGGRVDFILGESFISVHENNRPLLQATLTLSDDGECRIKCQGREMEFWQFRRTALENLFFELNP